MRIEGHAAEFDRVRIHQMDPFVSRRYIRGEFGTHLRHIDYYLGPGSRQAFWDGTCDLVPNHFSEMPLLLRRVNPALAIARAAGPDEHGYFSLGTNADYTSAFIGKVPFFLEVTPAQPFTYGQNQIHASQLAGWIRTEAGFPPIARRKPSPKDEAIAGHIAELIPDGCVDQSRRFAEADRHDDVAVVGDEVQHVFRSAGLCRAGHVGRGRHERSPGSVRVSLSTWSRRVPGVNSQLRARVDHECAASTGAGTAAGPWPRR
jgi:hypothetical protein